MNFFKRHKKEVDLYSPLEEELEKKLEENKEANRHFHNIKATVSPKTLEIFLEALRDGKIKREPYHG